MSASTTTEGAPRKGGVLASLITCDTETFARDHWGRQPLLSRRPGTRHEVLDLAGIDELLSERGLRTPFVRLTRNGVVTATRDYTAGGGAGAGIGDQLSDTKLVDLLLDGQTVVLQALHRTWKPIAELTSLLSAELAVPVQANVYVTPAEARGFDNHYDVHDVFVVQLAGTKHWQVHAPVHCDPLPDQPWTGHRAAVQQRATEAPLLEVVLEPGDVLYLPRGTVHGAVSRDGISAHLTLGVHPITGYAAAQAALTLLQERAELRTSLPAGLRLDSAAARDELQGVVKQLHEAIDALTPEAIAHALAGAVLPQTRPLPLPPLAQAAAVQNPGSVRLRDGLQTHLAGTELVTPFGTETFTEAEIQRLQPLLAGGTIDEPELAVRLLRHGIAVPA